MTSSCNGERFPHDFCKFHVFNRCRRIQHKIYIYKYKSKYIYICIVYDFEKCIIYANKTELLG